MQGVHRFIANFRRAPAEVVASCAKSADRSINVNWLRARRPCRRRAQLFNRRDPHPSDGAAWTAPTPQRLGRRRLGRRRLRPRRAEGCGRWRPPGRSRSPRRSPIPRVDLLASAAGLVGIVYAAKPPDEDHSFGHSSAEDLVALGQALLVTASAGLIGWNAVRRLAAPAAAQRRGRGACGDGGLDRRSPLGLVLWQGRVARRTGSRIVAADRLHYLARPAADARRDGGAGRLVAASASAGSTRWSRSSPAPSWCSARADRARGLERADGPGGGPGAPRRGRAIIARYPGVLGFHDLKTRTAGSRIFIQVHLELDGAQSLRAAHAIGAGVRHALLAAVPNSDVIIHKDPR